MTLVREEPELDRPVEGLADLIEFFRVGEKPREQWRVGTEHEKLGLHRESLEPIAYGGEQLVGTEYEGQRITLEPGGQLELSGAPLYTLHETCREFRDHIALLNHVSAEVGVVWVGLGVHPFATVDDVEWVPRDRYRIMRDVLGQRGALAHHMMKTTGGVQANFDYGDEADMARKLRVSLAASPIVTALYANSSISEGKVNGFLSRRAWIWRHTDPDRCGFLPFVFQEGWLEGDAYSRYTEWALDVPMLFIQRGREHHPVGGKTFRAYLRDGHGEHRATLADWNLHLTTLFPEVRLKRVIEVRGADAVPPGLVCGLPAIWKGILYDEEALGAAASRLGHWTFAEVDRLHADVSTRGLAAETPDGPVAAVAQEIVDLAARGLRQQGARNAAGEDETLFLDPLYEVLDRGESAARQLLERWEGPWAGKAEALVEYAAY
jgi:glutamate--cysteine ligase